MRCNFYTERYWVSFKEMICFRKNNQITPKAYSNEEVYKYDLPDFLNFNTYNFDNSSHYGTTSSGFMYYENKLFAWTDDSGGFWHAINHIGDLWSLLKTRFVNEYVFDLSFNEDIYGINPSQAWDSDKLNEWIDKAHEFIFRLLSIMTETYERYSTLLDFYSAKKSQLLDKVESLTRFNDTPQDSGEFSDDEHTTHITSSKNDYDTLMARIDEVDRKYRNLLKDWSNEFECLFIHEESL